MTMITTTSLVIFFVYALLLGSSTALTISDRASNHPVPSRRQERRRSTLQLRGGPTIYHTHTSTQTDIEASEPLLNFVQTSYVLRPNPMPSSFKPEFIRCPIARAGFHRLRYDIV
jgi:hypothetical protein